MNRVAIAVTIAILGGTAAAQPSPLTPAQIRSYAGREAPQIVVLTFGTGERIFERFGHAAICLRYAEEGREAVCFNYGVTNFEAIDALVWGFLRGHQKFWLEPDSWSMTLGYYEAEDRDIWEQVLPLTSDQARAIEHKLLYDLDGAHRFYDYDHFFDNCTTRVRDLVNNAVHDALYATTQAKFSLTYRQMALRGIAEYPPLTALTDFIVGRSLDDTPTHWQAMFLPDMLRTELEVHLEATPKLLYKRQGPAFPTTGETDRLPMLAIAFVFALPLLVATWRRRFERAATAWAALYLGFWGVLIWSLAIVSSIPALRINEMVLVMVPFDLVLPFLGTDHRRTYARWRLVELFGVSALQAIGVLHQPLWVPLIAAILPHAILVGGSWASHPPRRDDASRSMAPTTGGDPQEIAPHATRAP